MTESQVDLIAQLADRKARDFAGKLGDPVLTMNWVSRFNGYFAGYMCREADEYTAQESARILEKMKNNHDAVPAPKIPVVEESDGLDFLGEYVEGEDLL